MPLVTLTPGQKQRFQKALGVAFPDGPALNPILFAASGKTYKALAPNGYGYEQSLPDIIATAESESWVLELVSEALAKVPADPEFIALKADLAPAALAAAIDPFEVCRLTGTHVMVNRTCLRSALKRIHDPLGTRILVVRGERKTGKTHSLRLINYVYLIKKSFNLVSVDLEMYARLFKDQALVDAYDLAQQIVSGLRYPLKVPQRPTEAQWARWIVDFYTDFGALAAADPNVRWIVIDSLNAVPLAQSATDFIQELALRIDRDLAQFRLVLLGYGAQLPAEVQANAEEETIAAIAPKDLVEFIGKACLELGIPLDNTKVTSAVQNILNKVDLTAPEFLLNLPAAANEELKKIKQ